MTWKALMILAVALSPFSSFIGQGAECAETSCCAEIHSCCGHCPCPPKQSCSAAKPVTVDQQAVARTAQLSPRVEVELFTISLADVDFIQAQANHFCRSVESPPLDTSQKPQARLCLWLI